MGFNTIAKEIIQNAIKSVICIDNAFVEPYTKIEDYEEGEKYDETMSRELFNSFKKVNCTLDIYRFESMKQWVKDKEYTLHNRDLLILDWELIGDPPYKDALIILREALYVSSLPFVVIYTQQEDINQIQMNIFSFFDKKYSDEEERNKQVEALIDKIEMDSDIEDVEKKFDLIATELKEHLFVKKEAEFLQIAKDFLQKTFNDDYKDFLKFLTLASKEIINTGLLYGILKVIIYNQNKLIENTIGNPLKINILEGDRTTYLINNTLIIIFVKKKEEGGAVDKNRILPSEVFSSFAETIYKRPNSVLTLLDMEMKTIFRNNNIIIGRELYNIDELAFFHHHKHLRSEEKFYEFLRNCWKNQMINFNTIQNPMLFSVLEEYKTETLKFDEVMASYSESDYEKLKLEIIKLNYFYSFLKFNIQRDNKIRFGDLFSIVSDPEEEGGGLFLLCITANCDCMYPEEHIKHKFQFVQGSKESISTGLKEAETGFFSFFIYNSEPIVIRWSLKPFTLHLHQENNDISEPIHVLYHRENRYLIYEGTQKENYTQRIANESFSHASRVGIDLAIFNNQEDGKEPLQEHQSKTKVE